MKLKVLKDKRKNIVVLEFNDKPFGIDLPVDLTAPRAFRGYQIASSVPGLPERSLFSSWSR